MDDLISREALLAHLFSKQDEPLDIMKEIAKFPTVDAVPVVHGRWMWNEDWTPSTTDNPAECQYAGWECSNCKIDLADYLSFTIGEILYVDDQERPPQIKVCPNCGAHMDLPEEEEAHNDE